MWTAIVANKVTDPTRQHSKGGFANSSSGEGPWGEQAPPEAVPGAYYWAGFGAKAIEMTGCTSQSVFDSMPFFPRPVL